MLTFTHVVSRENRIYECRNDQFVRMNFDVHFSIFRDDPILKGTDLRRVLTSPRRLENGCKRVLFHFT